MAETGTTLTTEQMGGSVKRVSFAWTSDGSGVVLSDLTTKTFDGQVLMLVTDPDGSAAPTDNYDVAVLDESGDDILAVAGLNRDTANTETVVAALGAVAESRIQLSITAAGVSKEGVATLWIR